jgi:hypothetical protein
VKFSKKIKLFPPKKKKKNMEMKTLLASVFFLFWLKLLGRRKEEGCWVFNDVFLEALSYTTLIEGELLIENCGMKRFEELMGKDSRKASQMSVNVSLNHGGKENGKRKQRTLWRLSCGETSDNWGGVWCFLVS